MWGKFIVIHLSIVSICVLPVLYSFLDALLHLVAGKGMIQEVKVMDNRGNRAGYLQMLKSRDSAPFFFQSLRSAWAEVGMGLRRAARLRRPLGAQGYL